MSEEKKGIDKAHEEEANPIIAASRVLHNDDNLKFSIMVPHSYKVMDFGWKDAKMVATIDKWGDGSNRHVSHRQNSKYNIYSQEFKDIAIPSDLIHTIEVTDNSIDHIIFDHKKNHDVLDPRG